MRQSSIVIHRGRREEKYEIYVEDYVVSFLKEKPSAEEMPGIVFYGRRDKNGRRYTIYGAGQDRNLTLFDKYDLLEEVGCRLTQMGPVFQVRETGGIYEVKGYNVFYYDNEEMQEYLIHRNIEKRRKYSSDNAGKAGRPHYAVALQLGAIFIVLVAIVINSSNSYDKMKQLNQSAEEVFFVMENQEAEEAAGADEKENGGNIVVERERLQESMVQENENIDRNGEEDGGEQDVVRSGENVTGQTDGPGEEADPQPEAEPAEEPRLTQPAEEGAGTDSGTDAEQDSQGENTDGQEQANRNEGQEDTVQTAEEGVEALSRNVARYYEVKRGDTLYMISQRIYGDTAYVKKICELNQITDPDNIHYGQKIILP